MIPALTADLAPHLTAIHHAQAALDQANRATESPLRCLAPAGTLIRAQSELIARALDLLDSIGGDPETVEMQIQGRIRALAAQEDKGTP